MNDFVFGRPSSIAMSPQGFGIAQYGNDSHLAVLFYIRSVPNEVKSMQAGMRIHDAVPFVKIQQPGELTQAIDRPVTENDKIRFKTQWQAFQENRSQEADGVPIDFLFPGHPEIADNLRSAGVYTIEQCANLSAHAIDTIGMGAMNYKNAAAEYLDIGKGGAGYHRLARELQEEKAKNASLQRDVASLRDAYNELYAIVKKPRTLPDPEAFIPTVQSHQDPVHGLPAHMRAAQQVLDPVAPAAPNKTFMADLPKRGRPRKPWADTPAVETEGGAN